MPPHQTLTFSQLLDEQQLSSKEEYEGDDFEELVEVVAQRGLWNGYFFDSLQLIENKVEYSFTFELSGVYLWEIGQHDVVTNSYPSGILLEAAAGVHYEMLAEQILYKQTAANEDTDQYGVDELQCCFNRCE